MKSIIFSFLAICVAVALGSAPLTSPIPASCAILDQNWKLWDVTTKSFNSSDDAGPLQVNLCLDMEKSCAHTTNEPCSICQYRGDYNNSKADSYCLGYSKGETYTPIDPSLLPSGKSGFLATLSGDNHWCPANVDRVSYVHVLCGEWEDRLVFDGEYSPCVYNFTLHLQSDCSISPASFTPTFKIDAITPNAFSLEIDDGYPYEFWDFHVKVNGKYGYQGSHREVIIENLDPGTTYNVVVERDSGYGAILDVISPSTTLTITTLPANIGNFHTGITTSGTGTGFLLGLVVAFALVAVIVGFLKLRQSEWWADKFNGGKRSSGKGTFSLLDAEKSNAFDS